MKFRFGYVCLLFLFCTGCVSQSIKDVYPVGKIYQDNIEFRGMSVPLPEGNWEIIGRGQVVGGKYEQLSLAVIVDKKPVKALLITRDSVKNQYTGYRSNAYLKRTNVLFTDVTKNKEGVQLDGWLINHIRPGFNDSQSGAMKETYDYIISNKLVLPGNFIESFHILTGKTKRNKYLSYSYLVNPEAQGFDAPQNAEWASSDWNILKINSDSQKVAYIEDFKMENAALHQQFREVFVF